MVRRWLERVGAKETLGTAVPTLDDKNRIKWKTYENFKNCCVDTASLAVKMGMGRLNTAHKWDARGQPLLEHMFWIEPERGCCADETDVKMGEKNASVGRPPS
jgi:hypothetical protein